MGLAGTVFLGGITLVTGGITLAIVVAVANGLWDVASLGFRRARTPADVGDGRTKVRGTVRATETTTAPLADAECVGYRLVEKTKDMVGDTVTDEWKTRAKVRWIAPFVLDGEDDAVVVNDSGDAPKTLLYLDWIESTVVEPGKRPPDDVVAVIERASGDGEPDAEAGTEDDGGFDPLSGLGGDDAPTSIDVGTEASGDESKGRGSARVSEAEGGPGADAGGAGATAGDRPATDDGDVGTTGFEFDTDVVDADEGATTAGELEGELPDGVSVDTGDEPGAGHGTGAGAGELEGELPGDLSAEAGPKALAAPGSKRKYEVRYLPPDEEVVVFGRASDGVVSDERGKLYVSTRHPGRLAARSFGTVLFLTGAGLVTGVFTVNAIRALLG